MTCQLCVWSYGHAEEVWRRFKVCQVLVLNALEPRSEQLASCVYGHTDMRRRWRRFNVCQVLVLDDTPALSFARAASRFRRASS